MFSRKRLPHAAPRASRFRPRLEELESRLAPAGSLDIASSAPFAQYALLIPATVGAFGTNVLVLNNGNVVVSDPTVSGGQGAVYLVNGQTGALISSLKGGSPNDAFNPTLEQLADGNFLIIDPGWNHGVGEVTWASGTSGVSGVVNSFTSLVGSAVGDHVGSQVVLLPNGNYVVASPGWSSQTGAVTFANEATGVHGTITASNSLIGAAAGDQVGSGGVIPLGNTGNYVVDSPNWISQTGAVTWANGTTGLTGVVTSGNSLTGTNAGDSVGLDTDGTTVHAAGVTVLSATTGNYVVASGDWNNGTGAVTFAKWGQGVTGSVSSSNSLTGSFSGDHVGLYGVTVLTNGNYVVSSPNWNFNEGAVTFGSGRNGVTGTVSGNNFRNQANSLVGSFSGDLVGGIGSGASLKSGVVALANGDYAVASSNFDFGEGAVTWGNGNNFFGNGTTGTISSSGANANSIVGQNFGDDIGSGGLTPLPNGSYVIDSPNWGGGKGAVTWATGSGATTGNVTAANSLTGSVGTDNVGSGGVTALVSGGNNAFYVVDSPLWNVSAAGVVVTANVGAVTVENGTAAVSATVSGAGLNANSLVGVAAGDEIGSLPAASTSKPVVALPNGDFLVFSYSFSGGRGAVTLQSPLGNVFGPVNATNSLVGVTPDTNPGTTTDGDHVGFNFTSDTTDFTYLGNNYVVVVSPNWQGATGAVTEGTTLTGMVSGANSLVGDNPGDSVGSGGVAVLNGGNYVVLSPDWNSQTGAATWNSETAPQIGAVSNTTTSLFGTTATVPGVSVGDQVGSGGVTLLGNSGVYVVSSPAYNGNTGAATWVDGSTTGAGATFDGTHTIDAKNSLLGPATETNPGLTVAAGPSTVSTSFLAAFPSANTVLIGFTDPSQLTYALAETQNLSIDPKFLAKALNAGTPLAIQANNDITVSSPIVETAGTALTLSAGRSVLLYANITTAGGNLTLIANDTKADGVVDLPQNIPPIVPRLSGNAVITEASGVTLNAGAGTLAIDLKNSTDKTNNGAGVVTLLADTAASTTLSATTIFGVTINGTTPGDGTGTSYTQSVVTGPISLSGALSVSKLASVSAPVGTTFTIIHTTGPNAGVNGTFTGVMQGGTVTASDGTPFTINYAGGPMGDDVTLTVDAITSTTVQPDHNPAQFGSSVNFTITVTNTSSTGGPPPGTVQVTVTHKDSHGNVVTDDMRAATFDGSNGSVSTFSYSSPSTLAVGNYTVAAQYNPTPGSAYFGSSGSVVETIGYTTTTVVTSNDNPATYGEAVTLVATVTVTNNASSAAPAGTVEFFDQNGAVDLGPGIEVASSNSNGTAVWLLTTSTLTVIGHPITAQFTPTASSNLLASSNTDNGKQPYLETVANAPPVIVLNSDGSLLEQLPNGGFQVLSGPGTILAISNVIDAAGRDNVFAITSGEEGPQFQNTLWVFNSSLGWSELSSGSFGQISTATNSAGNAVVFGMLTDGELWENSSQFGWKMLSGFDTIASISAVTDTSRSATKTADSEVVFALTTAGPNNLWEYNSAAIPNGWLELSAGDFQQISAGRNAAGQALVYAVLVDQSLYEYNPDPNFNPASGHLAQLSGSGTIISVAAGGAANEFFVITTGAISPVYQNTLWEFTPTTGLVQKSPATFSSVSPTLTSTGHDAVFAVLTDAEFWEYDPFFAGVGWKQLLTGGAALGAAPVIL